MGKSKPVIIGSKFGRLRIQAEVERIGNTRMVLCSCDCGKEKVCSLYKLWRGSTKSCGCSRLKIADEKKADKTHTLYFVWKSMIDRCYHKSCNQYHNYGARGISVCDRWKNSMFNFVNDMGNRPSKTYSLDRIDVNANYAPGNCRWATPKMQGRNRRNNNLLEYNGQIKCASEWAEIFGVTKSAFRFHYNKSGFSYFSTKQ